MIKILNIFGLGPTLGWSMLIWILCSSDNFSLLLHRSCVDTVALWRCYRATVSTELLSKLVAEESTTLEVEQADWEAFQESCWVSLTISQFEREE